jgi:hypothetical protein
VGAALQVQVPELWSAAGVIVGFQVTAFTLRINREIAMGDKKEVMWLPPADYVNLLSLMVTLFGVFVAPIMSLYGVSTAAAALGFAMTLLACYPFALAGHYKLFDPQNARKYPKFFPSQEKIAVGLCGLLGITYIVLVAAWR